MSEEPGDGRAAPTRDALTAEVERLRGLLAGSQIAEGLRGNTRVLLIVDAQGRVSQR